MQACVYAAPCMLTLQRLSVDAPDLFQSVCALFSLLLPLHCFLMLTRVRHGLCLKHTLLKIFMHLVHFALSVPLSSESAESVTGKSHIIKVWFTVSGLLFENVSF